MYFNRFDIIEAYYLFFSDFHGGIQCEKYRRMCHVKRKLKDWQIHPFLDYDYLTQNGKEIYDNLVAKELAKQNR